MGLQMVPPGMTHQILWILGSLLLKREFTHHSSCIHTAGDTITETHWPCLLLSDKHWSLREGTGDHTLELDLLLFSVESLSLNPFLPAPSCYSALDWRFWISINTEFLGDEFSLCFRQQCLDPLVKRSRTPCPSSDS